LGRLAVQPGADRKQVLRRESCATLEVNDALVQFGSLREAENSPARVEQVELDRYRVTAPYKPGGKIKGRGFKY